MPIPFGDIGALQQAGLLPTYGTDAPAPAHNAGLNWTGTAGERPEIGLVPEDHAGVIGGHSSLEPLIISTSLNQALPSSPSHSHKPNAFWLPFLLTGDPTFVSHMEYIHQNFLDNSPFPAANNAFRNYYSPREWAWTMRDVAQLAYLQAEGYTTGTGYISFFENTRDWCLEMIDPNSTFWEPVQDPRYQAFRQRFGLLSLNQNRSGYYWGIVWFMERFIGVTLQHILSMGFEDWRPIAEFHFKQVSEMYARHSVKGCCANQSYNYFYYSQALQIPWDDNASLETKLQLLEGWDWDSEPVVFNGMRPQWEAVPDGELISLSAVSPTGARIDGGHRAPYDRMIAEMAAQNGIAGAREIADAYTAALQQRGDDGDIYKLYVVSDGGLDPNPQPEPPTFNYTVPSNTVASGGKFVRPAWRRAMAANTWVEIPCANRIWDINPADDPAINPNHPGNAPWRGAVGQNAMVTAWCGAVIDTEKSRFALPYGGGHGDYAGNESYYLDLESDAPAWVMPRWPSGAVGNEMVLDDGNESLGLYADGRVRASHSYNKMQHVPGLGWVLGPQGNSYRAATGGPGRAIIIDDYTGEMTHRSGWPGEFFTASGTAWDPKRRVIWQRPTQSNQLFRYSVDNDTWSQQGPTWSAPGGCGLVYLPDPYDVLVAFGFGFANSIAVFAPSTNSLRLTPSVSGSVVGNVASSQAPPIHVPDNNRLAFWNQKTSANTGIINYYEIPADPLNGVWQLGQYPVAPENVVTPTVATGNGTYGRFQYVPRLNGFVVLNSVFQNPYFYALD